MSNPVSARRVRQVVQAQGKALQDSIVPAVQALAKNEQITRTRIETHERRLDALEAFEMRTWWERLRWLAVGR